VLLKPSVSFFLLCQYLWLLNPFSGHFLLFTDGFESINLFNIYHTVITQITEFSLMNTSATNSNSTNDQHTNIL